MGAYYFYSYRTGDLLSSPTATLTTTTTTAEVCSMTRYIFVDSGRCESTTITNTILSADLVQKNWRWFHVFAERLIDWSHEVQNQVQSIFMPRRQQGKVVASQQRRHKRKSYLLRLGSA